MAPQSAAPTGTALTGAAIREWREQRGISQARLARTLRLDHRTVMRWELGRHRVPGWLELVLEPAAKRIREQQRHREYRKRVKREAWGRELKRRDRERRELAGAVRDRGAWW